MVRSLRAIRICRIITAIFLTVYMKKQLIMPKRHRLLFRRLFSRRIQQQNFYGKMATLIITEMMLNTTFRSEYPTHTCLTMQILIFLMWLNSELSLKRVQCKNMTWEFILQITQTEMLNMMPKVIITVYGLVLQEQLTAYRLLSTIRTQADTL